MTMTEIKRLILTANGSMPQFFLFMLCAQFLDIAQTCSQTQCQQTVAGISLCVTQTTNAKISI